MSDIEWAAVGFSARIAALTVLLCLPASVALASWSGGRRTRGRWLIDACIMLPLCLSPALLSALMLPLIPRVQDSALGTWLHSLGLGIQGLPEGLVVASSLFVMPLMVRLMRPAFEVVDTRRVMTARTLGASRWDAWWNVTMAQARPAVLSAAVLGFAVAWGEGSAALVLAASLGPHAVQDATVAMLLAQPTASPDSARLIQPLGWVGLGLAAVTALVSEGLHQVWRRRALPEGARGGVA